MRKLIVLLALVLLPFAPARAQLCPGVAPWVFVDVPASHAFCTYVTWMAQNNVTLGCRVIDANNREYCPDDSVSRLQMAAFMNRLGSALFPATCAAGQIMKWNGAAWTCANDNIGGSAGGGTVTSVLAGTGLTASPNPITGAGSLNLAPTFQLPQGCANNQIPKWNGSAWTCAADAAGGTGTVTQVDTGTGLTGGPVTSTGTIAIASFGVGTAQLATSAVTTTRIADAAVTTAKIADGAVTTAKIAPGAIGSGALGSGLASARPPYAVRLIESSGAGQFISVALGADGLPLIAYYAQSSGDLKVAHCETVDCASTTITTIDSVGDVGQYLSAVVQPNALPALVYYDATNTVLKAAFCADVRCTTATFATIDSSNDVGKYASMTTAADGSLVVSYFDETLDDLKLARCGTVPCFFNSSWTIATPVSAGNVGRGTAITTTFVGSLSLIAYFDATLPAVRLALCNSSVCDAPTLTTIHPLAAGRVAEGIAITLNHAGVPVVSFIDRVAGGNGNLRIVVCDSVACAAPATRTGGSTNFEVGSTALTIPFDNFPIALGGSSISAGGGTCDALTGTFTQSGSLMKCLDATCGADATHNPPFAGGGSAAINSTGNPIVAFRRCDGTGSRLAVIHCATPTCLGHARPR